MDAHVFFNINHHIVWSTKYRRKVLISEIETKLKEILVNVAQEKGFEITEIEVKKPCPCICLR